MWRAGERRSRPGLLLAILLPLTLLVEGGVYSFLYPRLALLAWILPAVLATATAGSALYVLKLGTSVPRQWVGAIVAVLVAENAAVFSVLARGLLLLERHEQARSWAMLLRPEKWWALQKAVVRLDLCCSRGGGTFSPLAHWSFLCLELAATLGGAVFVVVVLQRQRLPDGRLPK
jgi:hypothetical protein